MKKYFWYIFVNKAKFNWPCLTGVKKGENFQGGEYFLKALQVYQHEHYKLKLLDVC